MQSRSWHDFVQVDDEGNFTEINHYDWESVLGVQHNSDSSPRDVESHANGPTYTGSLSNESGGDMLAALEQRIALLTAAMEGRPVQAAAALRAATAPSTCAWDASAGRSTRIEAIPTSALSLCLPRT